MACYACVAPGARSGPPGSEARLGDALPPFGLFPGTSLSPRHPKINPMAPQSKAQFLNDVHTLLKKRYKPKPDKGSSRLTVLESVVYGICHEGSTREQANQALSRFKDGFFDWNEVRVSTVDEIQGVLVGLSDADSRAPKIRRFLRQLFEKTYAFNLEAFTKKPLKESLKALSEYEALQSEYVEASVTRLALGGHAIPVDVPTRRVMERLGLADRSADPSALRSFLERSVPKNRASEFIDLIEDLAHDVCIDPEPDCPRCELRKVCPTGLARKEEAAVAAKSAATQARVNAKAKEKAEKGAVVHEKPPEIAKVAPKAAAKEAHKPPLKEALKPPSPPPAKAVAPPRIPPKSSKPSKGRGGTK